MIERIRQPADLSTLDAPLAAVLACALIFVLSLGGCQQEPPEAEPTDPPAAPTRPLEGRLTEDYARFRSAQIGAIRYALEVELDPGEVAYSGQVQIDFELTRSDAPVTVDFAGGTVERLAVNGAEVAPQYNGWFVTLDAGELDPGSNQVEIAFTHAYSEDGGGLNRHVDPVDGRVYLYSHLEPYDANRLFPCFDQPDLKAEYQLTVTAPAGWTVVSAAPEARVEPMDDRVRWRFERTPPIPSYVFSLHAGPYRRWEARAGRVPLRLFARQSVASRVDAAAWFEVTRQGLAFYQDYLDRPYPFAKYDQVLVPGLNIGAMENVAAVTFRDEYVPHGPPTRRERFELADVILHEMAHAWFGNFVTMDWWNGLWLKEALATYLAHLAMARATEFTDAWHGFFIASKERAYRADSQVTTHPIEVPVPDTRDAFANFDAITYRKGAAVLTQLAHRLGKTGFRDGLRRYLEQHRWGAAELEDLVAALEAASGTDLEGWVEDWLRQPGFDTVSAGFDCAGGYVTRFVLEQQAPEHWPVLRHHRLQLGLYRHDGMALRALRILPLTLSGERTPREDLAGLACPSLVYPNLGDWGFVDVRLDPVTLAGLDSHLGAVSDPLLRSQLWHALWSMVRDAQLGLDRFTPLALRYLPQESNERVSAQLLDYLLEDLQYRERLTMAGVAVDGRQAQAIEDTLWSGTLVAADELQTLWFDYYVQAARSAGGLERLASLLSGEPVATGLACDQSCRWRLVIALASRGHPAAADLVGAERARDPTDLGRRKALAAEAATPDPDIKARWLERLQARDDGLDPATQREIVRVLFPAHQRELHERFADRLLEPLPELARTRDDAFLREYARLLPATCSPASEARLARAGALEIASPVLDRALAIARQEDARCIAIGERLASEGDVSADSRTGRCAYGSSMRTGPFKASRSCGSRS